MTYHITYADAGVDVDEGARAVDKIKEAVARTARPGVMEGLGGFGCLFDGKILKDMQEPILVSGTDGVGTKIALAERLGNVKTVGLDLVAMCADDVVVCGAEPLFFLDYVSVGKLESDVMADIVSGIALGCEQAGCALIGGEMAEHPGVMDVHDFDLAGFCVGAVDKPKMLGSERVKCGDVVIALASNGIHSNGYSLVRAAVTNKIRDDELIAPRPELNGKNLAESLLAPTVIYAGGLVRMLQDGAPIHALAHITGGGITENLNRALPKNLDACINVSADGAPTWDVPPVITYVSDAAHLTFAEAFKTFNMGVGMCAVVAPEDVASITSAFEVQGFTAFTIGKITQGSGKVVYA